MSLKSKLEKLLARISAKEIPCSTSYDSRARFIKNATQSTHGIGTRSAYTGYMRKEKDKRPSITLTPSIGIKYMQRKHGNSVMVQQSVEVKYIDDNTILLKVTSNVLNMLTGANTSRWSHNDADARHTAESGVVSKTTAQLFLIQADPTIKISLTKDSDLNYLIIGAKGESKQLDTGNKLTLTDSAGNKVVCLELKGVNAKIWEEPTDDKIGHILDPGVVEYKSPKFKAKPNTRLFDSLLPRIGEPVTIKNLLLEMVAIEGKLNSATGKLTTALDISDIIITCNLCRGAVLTYSEGGETISRDVAQGEYRILLDGMNNANLGDYRKAVITTAKEISVDFDVNRLDFLTSLDLEEDTILRLDSSLSERVDSVASISTGRDAKSVNTDDLLNRISIINIEDDD